MSHSGRHEADQSDQGGGGGITGSGSPETRSIPSPPPPAPSPPPAEIPGVKTETDKGGTPIEHA